MPSLRASLRPSRLLPTLLVAMAVTALVLWLAPSNSYLLLPDRAHEVAPKVHVQGEKPDRSGGGIYFVDVIERKASLLERLFPGVRTGSTLVPGSALNPGGVSDSARRREDLRQMVESQSVAAAVALRALGYKVTARPIGVRVANVYADGPAARLLRPSDLIVAVDGQAIHRLAQLRARIGAHRPGERVRLTIRRGSEEQVVVVKTVADPQNHSRAIVGIIASQASSIRLPIKVQIDLGSVGGPSAGLAFALDIMEELGRDVDRGYRVAATGEIGLDGSVAPIGGVRQKIFGVRKAGVDILLVPAGENAREARRHAGGVRVIAVKTFPQALRALATLPPHR